jgi:hypothetical protein
MKIKRTQLSATSLIASLVVCSAAASKAAWKPVSDKMMTTWGGWVTPENAWREYPRPQFERANWQNLNGLCPSLRTWKTNPGTMSADPRCQPAA